MAPAKRRKILLVDDSLTSLMMHRMLLVKGPYDIVTARDGSEAITKAVEERPDLIIMDVVMPKVTGFQACKKLRSMEATKQIPVLLVTTRGGAESAATGFACGANDYITKPVNAVELLEKVKSYLDK